MNEFPHLSEYISFLISEYGLEYVCQNYNMIRDAYYESKK